MNRGLLATRQDLAGLQNRVGRRPFDTIYENLRKRCALVLKSNPITETEWRSRHAQGVWSAAVTAARACQGRIFDLIICHHIDANGAYRDRAIEELKSLANWSTWTDPCYNAAKANLCTAECCTTMAVALDWLAEDLGEADRLRCLHSLRCKGIRPYNESVDEQAWWYTCYHNWNAVVNSGCGLGALALQDEYPEAAEAVTKARRGLRPFFDALGREGGWDEGIGYWGYALRYLLLFGQALDRQTDDRGVFHQRGMESTGHFGVYFSPNGHSASFGDAPSAPLYGALYLLAKRYGVKEVCWWLDSHALHRDVSTTGWSDAGLSLLFRPVDMPDRPRPDLSRVKVFNEIGWAAISDQWPEPEMYVSLKTGDLAANHSHLDMNSVQIQTDGEMLLSDLGNPPFTRAYFTPNRYDFYEAQAQGHNTLVIGDRDHRIDAQGQIVEAETGELYRWVAGSAGSALGDTVRFNRHIVMLMDPQGKRGETLVILDEVTNALPEKVAAYWHTFGDLRLDGEAGAIVGRRAGLHFRTGATVAIACTTDTHKIGNLSEQVLCVKTAPATQIAIAMVFARNPIETIDISQTSRGHVTLKLPMAELHFKGSRRHLKLDGLELK